MSSSNELADLKALVAGLQATVKGLLDQQAAVQAEGGSWGATHTGRGHPDARSLPRNHPMANPHQVVLTGEELEDKVFEMEARLTALETQPAPVAKVQGSGSK